MQEWAPSKAALKIGWVAASICRARVRFDREQQQNPHRYPAEYYDYLIDEALQKAKPVDGLGAFPDDMDVTAFEARLGI